MLDGNTTLTRSRLSLRLVTALAVLATNMLACSGLEEGICEPVPDAVVERTPPSLPPLEVLSIVHLQTLESNWSSSGECRVDYRFVISGVGGIWTKSSPGSPGPMNYFSTTAPVETGVIGPEGDRLVVTISVPQRESSGEYEAAFLHPDGRRVETRFWHYGFE
jgi:hypothetical protein